MNVSETTQELIEKKYANIFSKNKDIDFTDEPEDKEYIKVDDLDHDFDFEDQADIDKIHIEFKQPVQPIKPLEEFKSEQNDDSNLLENADDSKISNNVNVIGPLEVSHDDPTSSDNDSGIIVTEVNLVTPERDRKPRHIESLLGDQEKLKISEDIFSTLIREIQEFMFPVRIEHSSDSKRKFDSKYNERVPQNIIPNQPIIDDDNSNNMGDDDNISEMSFDKYESEIMHNFHVMRNFEMKRTRAEKNKYDGMVFMSYMDEVFRAIRSKEPLFLKAFSKPIQKDYLE